MAKRIFDILGSLFLLIVFFPLLAVITIAVRVLSGSPIIFKQERLGYREVPFIIYKFRTMVDDPCRPLEVILGENKAITGIGKWLRKTHIDELPQLWNVLRGDMSLVGPRPWSVNSNPFIKVVPYQDYKKRFEAKPGLTGPMQLRKRMWVSRNIKKALELDISYIAQQSFFEDLKILLATVVVVFKKQGM